MRLACSLKRITILLAELRESFRMAMSAVAAHKLRSALTLLGVLVGVFSIIVVMTAMRVMQSFVESELSQLGDQTFMVRKFPTILFNQPEGLEKIRRRKNITLQEGRRLLESVTLARAVGVESYFWAGQIQTRYKRTAPDVRLYGETPGSFPARNWIVQDGRGIADADVEGARDVCVLGNSLARTIFPVGSAVGERVKIDGLNYTVVGVLQPKGGSLGGDQDKFAVIPLTTGLNRFGYIWRSLTILVQARDRASYDACVEEVRGILRVIRKVPPGEPDSFDIASNDSLDRPVQRLHPDRAHRGGRGQLDCVAGRRHRHHEHHARLGHRAHPRDRDSPRGRRQEAQHHDAVHHRGHRALRDRRGHWRAVRHPRRERDRLVLQARPGHSLRLDWPGAVDLLRGRRHFRDLPRVQSGEPGPDRIAAVRIGSSRKVVIGFQPRLAAGLATAGQAAWRSNRSRVPSRRSRIRWPRHSMRLPRNARSQMAAWSRSLRG